MDFRLMYAVIHMPAFLCLLIRTYSNFCLISANDLHALSCPSPPGPQYFNLGNTCGCWVPSVSAISQIFSDLTEMSQELIHGRDIPMNHASKNDGGRGWVPSNRQSITILFSIFWFLFRLAKSNTVTVNSLPLKCRNSS